MLFPLAFSASTLAQELKPIADNTLGAESSVVTPTSPQGDRIDGGAIRGANLFHSFSKFDIGEGREAYFANPSGIENILSRVTGSDASRIFGKLGVLGNANLFLINPNGIIFGRNASLDVRGSFVGTTANAIQFGNQGFFSATNPNTPALLTVNPSAFFFNQIAAAPIQNNSVAPAGTDPAGLNALGLRVPDGKSLLLVGGNVSMDGGRLNANGGRVELGGLGEPGTVALGVDGDNLSLKFPENIARTEVSLINQAGVFVTGAGGGNITVNARNIEILEGSILNGGIGQNLGTPETVAGDITLNATGEIKVAGTGSVVDNLVRLGSLGNGGNITIDSGSFSLRDGAQLSASTLGQGDAGSVTISAQDKVSFVGDFSIAGSQVAPGAVGKGGDVTITTGSLSLTNGAQLSADTGGRGDAGSVTISAQDRVSFNGFDNNGNPSGAFSSVLPTAVGKGGNISITTGSLSLTNGAQVFASTRGRGDAGSVTISARDRVSLDGEASNGNPSAAFSSVESGGVGKGSSISITTGSLSLTNGAQLIALTRGRGDAGSVTISARDRVSFDGFDNNGNPSGAFSSVEESGAVGNAGDISIMARSLALTNGAQLIALTRGQGDAGNITITAQDIVFFDGVGSNGGRSGAFSSVQPRAVGNGGDISIMARSLALTNGAALSASSFGGGAAGNIEVASSSIRLNNQAFIGARTASGNGGNITLRVRDLLLLRRRSEVSTTAGTAQQGGDGGSITINTPNGFIVAVPSENSDITANAYTGTGGRVQINASGIYGTQFREKENPQTSDITASSQFGRNGTVELNTPDIDPNSALINLPSVPVDTELAQGCNSPNYAQSSFIITGRGGLPPNPKDILTPDAVQVDWVTLNPEIDKNSRTNISTNPKTTTPAPIVEATGWVFGPKGEVIFTAQAPIQNQNSWQTQTKCHEK